MFTSIKRRCFYISIGTFLLLVIIWLLVGLLDGKANPNRSDRPDEHNAIGAEVNISNRGGLQSNPVLRQGTSIVVFKVQYTKCGHSIIEDKAYNTQTKSKQINLYEQQYTGWTLDEFIPGKAVFKKTIDAYCPKHFIIGEENGYLTIFKTNPENGNLSQIEKTNIKADMLDEVIKLKLMDGIVMDTAEEVELFVENVGS